MMLINVENNAPSRIPKGILHFSWKFGEGEATLIWLDENDIPKVYTIYDQYRRPVIMKKTRLSKYKMHKVFVVLFRNLNIKNGRITANADFVWGSFDRVDWGTPLDFLIDDFYGQKKVVATWSPIPLDARSFFVKYRRTRTIFDLIKETTFIRQLYRGKEKREHLLLSIHGLLNRILITLPTNAFFIMRPGRISTIIRNDKKIIRAVKQMETIYIHVTQPLFWSKLAETISELAKLIRNT